MALAGSVSITEVSENLKHMIVTRKAVVGVVGIGYVGLPLAVEKAKVQFEVIGFDRNAVRVEQVNRGFNYIRDVDDDDLARVVASGMLSATTDFRDLARCDVIVICVPTPLTAHKDPDTSYIEIVTSDIAKILRPGQLVALESTTYPGTTNEILAPILSKGGLTVGRDFFLAFSPERVDPGNKRYTTKNTNKVVGGITPTCLEVAATFYEQTIETVVRVSTARVAEMTKVFENTFRAVNIALVNEMALLCDRMEINIWEVLDAAATKPFGIMPFLPGPGVGGHCIPLDPFYLAWKAREYDFHTRFIELAGEINNYMPYFVREKIIRALNDRARAAKTSTILLIGIAYKKDIPDWRESPTLKIIELLEGSGATVLLHDPYVPSFQGDGAMARYSVPLTPALVAQADCVVIVTDHTCIDWKMVSENARLIVDTRNATKGVARRENVVVL